MEQQYLFSKSKESSGDSSDDYVESNIYEKKLNILTVLHLLLQKAQSNIIVAGALETMLLTLKDFIVTLCGYFVEFQAHRNMP